jgi:hypothetical protein
MSNWKGEGKVHGSAQKDINWRRADYDRVIRTLEKTYGRMKIRRAIETAALKAAKAGVKASVKRLSEETTLPKEIIAKKIKAYKHGSGMEMAIGMLVSDTARPLSDFAFTPKTPTYRTAPEVEIYRGQKKVLGKGAFVAKMPSGHIGIFEREKEKRRNYDASGGYDMKSAEHMHINSLPAPSVTGLFKASEGRHQQIWDLIFNKFQECVIQEVETILKGDK